MNMLAGLLMLLTTIWYGVWTMVFMQTTWPIILLATLPLVVLTIASFSGAKGRFLAALFILFWFCHATMVAMTEEMAWPSWIALALILFYLLVVVTAANQQKRLQNSS